MTVLAEAVASQLASLTSRASPPLRYLLAFSGGLDSTVLLHVLVNLRNEWPRAEQVPIVAVHVDHQLHNESAAWSAHCSGVAASFGVEFVALTAIVADPTSAGLEAAARKARYAAIAEIMRAGDWLLSAHHEDDQAETLLLNLLRGSGPVGIAGMPPLRPIADGYLVRPMLNIERDALLDYAAEQQLRWIEDPSNAQNDFDRNFLRNDVIPRLEARWPSLSRRLSRSASHAADAAAMLQQLADIDLHRLGDCPARLPIDDLLELPEVRQRNVIRAAIRRLGLETPTSQQINTILSECLAVRRDAEPFVRWSKTSVRRYRNGLYVLPADLPQIRTQMIHAEGRWPLGAGLGELQLRRSAQSGLCPSFIKRGLAVRTRNGGEKIKPIGQLHTHKLKKLLQEDGVVPWMRDRLPLLYCGDQLLAVGDLWLAADAVKKPGIAVHWINPPALH